MRMSYISSLICTNTHTSKNHGQDSKIMTQPPQGEGFALRKSCGTNPGRKNTIEGQHLTEVQSLMRSPLLVSVGAPQKMDQDSSSLHRVYVCFINIIIIIINSSSRSSRSSSSSIAIINNRP